MTPKDVIGVFRIVRIALIIILVHTYLPETPWVVQCAVSWLAYDVWTAIEVMGWMKL